MLNPFTGNINKEICQMLLRQTGLDATRVLNAQSIRGVSLDKYLLDNKISLDVSDTLILYRVEQESNEENLAIETQDANYIYVVYKAYIVIYGQKSTELANILRARIESEKNRVDMLSIGINVESVSSIATVTEFKNETIWPRTDFDFLVGVEYQVEQLSTFEDILDVKNIDFIKTSNK